LALGERLWVVSDRVSDQEKRFVIQLRRCHSRAAGWGCP
jgi:hypothetical protein